MNEPCFMSYNFSGELLDDFNLLPVEKYKSEFEYVSKFLEITSDMGTWTKGIDNLIKNTPTDYSGVKNVKNKYMKKPQTIYHDLENRSDLFHYVPDNSTNLKTIEEQKKQIEELNDQIAELKRRS
jgi:hypothetical protein